MVTLLIPILLTSATNSSYAMYKNRRNRFRVQLIGSLRQIDYTLPVRRYSHVRPAGVVQMMNVSDDIFGLLSNAQFWTVG